MEAADAGEAGFESACPEESDPEAGTEAEPEFVWEKPSEGFPQQRILKVQAARSQQTKGFDRGVITVLRTVKGRRGSRPGCGGGAAGQQQAKDQKQHRETPCRRGGGCVRRD